jgi:hypothetical protein
MMDDKRMANLNDRENHARRSFVSVVLPIHGSDGMKQDVLVK